MPTYDYGIYRTSIRRHCRRLVVQHPLIWQNARIVNGIYIREFEQDPFHGSTGRRDFSPAPVPRKKIQFIL